MDGYRFENVNLVLAEPNWQVRETLKTTLHQVGFRDIFATDRMDRLRTAIDVVEPDLVIAETELRDGNTCEMFFEIRHHLVANNPFLPIIALSRSTDLNLVRAVIDSGADHLLVKPISTGQLIERVVTLIHARKPFVVTTDYIGPDRRKESRPGPGVPLFDVPNSLRAMATGEMDRECIQQAINAAAAVINEQKMMRHAYQITWLVERILAAYDSQDFGDAVTKHLERLLYVAQDISRRMVGTSYAHVSGLCESLTQVTSSVIGDGDSPSRKDIQLLPELSRAIAGAFKLGEEVAEISRDISRSVAAMGGG